MNYRVLVLTTALDYGGAEVQVVNLATGLAMRGLEVMVVSMVRPVAFLDQLRAANVALATLNMSPGIPNPFAILRLRTIIEKFRPDVVHSHMYHANILARIVRLTIRTPRLICTAHNISEGGVIRELLYRFTDRFADLTTNVSLAAVHRYIEKGLVSKNKIEFVPNGVDTVKFQRSEDARKRVRNDLGIEDKFVWICIARFEKAKDHETLIRAFKKQVETDLESVLLLVGKGQFERDVSQLVADLGLSDKVRFLGVRDDIPDLLSAADAYVMSSLWEGLPMVLLEASASELPIVATRAGGNEEIVLENENGFLVPVASPVDLAKAMIKLRTLPMETLQQMGLHGKQVVLDNYSFQSVLNRWQCIYSGTIKR